MLKNSFPNLIITFNGKKRKNTMTDLNLAVTAQGIKNKQAEIKDELTSEAKERAAGLLREFEAKLSDAANTPNLTSMVLHQIYQKDDSVGHGVCIGKFLLLEEMFTKSHYMHWVVSALRKAGFDVRATRCDMPGRAGVNVSIAAYWGQPEA